VCRHSDLVDIYHSLRHRERAVWQIFSQCSSVAHLVTIACMCRLTGRCRSAQWGPWSCRPTTRRCVSPMLGSCLWTASTAESLHADALQSGVAGDFGKVLQNWSRSSWHNQAAGNTSWQHGAVLRPMFLFPLPAACSPGVWRRACGVRGGAAGRRGHQDLRVPGAQGAALPAGHVRVLRSAGAGCQMTALCCCAAICIGCMHSSIMRATWPLARTLHTRHSHEPCCTCIL
jgi:hypothetical protein